MFLRSLPLLILALAAAPAAAEEPLGAAQIVEAVTGATTSGINAYGNPYTVEIREAGTTWGIAGFSDEYEVTGTWWLEGERGRIGVEVMLTPELPPRLQKLAIESVHPASDELEGAVAGALEALRRGTDLSPLLLPIRSASWVACDGDRTAAVLLTGAHVDVRLVINLDADPVVTFAPEERFPSPW